ncbi:hypothetical protein EYF80_009425 [Liparis tanakae]|uniref:Myb/SANT-like DNA-binding domain-containing protein n=1 Tax=Liparis tanakae TaxID=230148 RepID=A0A4Z2IRE2_9TELE|nr:hypothetical protein EYF80_009425 [Liparis tanakae]
MENTRATTHFWTEEQTECMLNILKELNILKFMDGRKTRNGGLFQKAALKMVKAGFPRTAEQIRIRWKNVKKAFFLAKRDNGASGRGHATCPCYDVLDDLLGSRSVSLVKHSGVDSGVQLPTTVGTRTQQSRRMRDIDVLVNHMQIMTQDWKEDMARSEAREEQLIASILRTDRMWVPSMHPMIWGMLNFCSNLVAIPMASSVVGTLMKCSKADVTIPSQNWYTIFFTVELWTPNWLATTLCSAQLANL